MVPVAVWCIDNLGVIGGGATVVSGWAGWSLKNWLDKRYERRRSDDPDKKRLRAEQQAREVLSTGVIQEFADSTSSAVIMGERFWKRVEHISCDSMTIQDKMDRRAKHAINNFDTELEARFAKLHDEMRTRVSDSQAVLVSAIKDLQATMLSSVAALDKKLDIHIAVDEVKRPG